MRLYLIRHARPDVASGICYGRTDLHALPEEEQQALSKLVPALPLHVPMFSSPLLRCRTLAAQLAAALGSGDVMHDARLAEMDFGRWEMRAWQDIPRAEVDAWADSMHVYRPGGGENVMSMVERVRAFLDGLRERNMQQAIVVCHAGTIRVLTACRDHDAHADIAIAATRGVHAIDYGGLIVLDYQKNNCNS